MAQRAEGGERERKEESGGRGGGVQEGKEIGQKRTVLASPFRRHLLPLYPLLRMLT